MKRFVYRTFLIILVTAFQPLAFGLKLFDPTRLFAPEKDEREIQIVHLKKEHENLRESTQVRLRGVQDASSLVERQISEAKAHLKESQIGKDQEFFNKKISLLNETYQAQLDIQFTLKEIPSLIEQQIKVLEDYLRDTEFKGLLLEPRAFYPYELVQSSIKKVLDQEERIKTLLRQKNDSMVALENQKKKLAAATKEYQEKKKEQEEFSIKEPEVEQTGELSFKQKGQIIDLQERFEGHEQQLAELQIQATTYKIALINTTIFVEQERQKVFKNNLARAKSGLRIAESEVQEAKEKLEKLKQTALASKDARYDEIKRLAAEHEKLKREMETLSKRFDAPLLEKEEFSAWTVEQPSVEAYVLLCKLGSKETLMHLLDRKIELLHAEIQLENAKLAREEVKCSILITWYDLTHRRFKDNDEIIVELKKFKEREAEITRDVTILEDKRSAAINHLNVQNKELTNLRNFVQDVQKEKDVTFKRFSTHYNACLARTAEAEKIITEHIDVNGKLIEVYSNLITTLNGTKKEISIIAAELETKSIWQRSQYAISLLGLKNILPDLGYFLVDLYHIGMSFFVNLTWNRVFGGLKGLVQSPGKLLLWAIIFFLVISFFLLLKRRLPQLAEHILAADFQNILLHIIIKSFGCLLVFLSRYLSWLYGWFLLLCCFYFDIIPELFPEIIFFLASIVYLSYFSRKLIHFFAVYNRTHNFTIFGQAFENRFIVVASIFFYLTIFVLFFREAFVLATIHKSELPRVLLAGYSILLRTLIIFSVGKEEIITLLVHRGTIANWLARIIDNYYYLLLVGIITFMVMSDPYVGGYGNLVSYILWGIIGTIILVRLLYMLHTYIKKRSEGVFFSTGDEAKRERFGYAKTWYGVFVIALFLFFVLCGIGLVTKIWGLPVFLVDIWKVIDYGIFSTGIEKGQPVWFTPGKLFVLIAFIVAGFFSSIAFNRFVLHRIFDILPVDLGIQNTVTNITRYLVVVISIYLGFQWAGLGNLLIAIGIVIGSIGYIVKEPLGDFISYFIILVQRPIQIGDYVMIDKDTQGVVRKITPRSVILRRKNSYSIILPNSMILNHSVNNWSYGRNFIAFDDIYVTISYRAEPAEVKKVILEVLDESNDVLKSPPPVIRLWEFGEYGYVFTIRGFISNINILRRWDIASDVRFSLVTALTKHGIELAVPTRIILREEPNLRHQADG